MNVVLISTYELGRQPFGLASPAAWLKAAGASVTCLDLSVQPLDENSVAEASLVAFYVPMHTATRISIAALERIKRINPRTHLCFYGLYAPVNENFLRRLGAQTILGGEFEQGLLSVYERLKQGPVSAPDHLQREPIISLSRQNFLVPERSGLHSLSSYAYLDLGNGRRQTAGYTEASRGCKHLCRHCPIVPVYQGVFRIVQEEVVLEDIRRQVEAGAGHITFGDPDFFNGIGHAIPLVETLHRLHPGLTYDVTIKIEHLLKHAQHLQTLRDTGCLFVTSAVESVDNSVLTILDKGHTKEDFIQVVEHFRRIGLMLAPTFVTFTPWTTIEGYAELLRLLEKLELVDYVAPIQLAIRLVIPANSRLLELAEAREVIGEYDEAALSYLWEHQDSRVERLYKDVFDVVKKASRGGASRRAVFHQIWQSVNNVAGTTHLPPPGRSYRLPEEPVPRMSENWFC